ncbi:hypothetical protein MMC22_002363 [Lobaria immixta]|nr:hypothetical protein [Lobaria immixta]
MSTTFSNEYAAQYIPDQYIKLSVLEAYVKDRPDEFGEDWRLTSNRGQFKLFARRALSQDEILHLQRTSYPGYRWSDD